MDLVKPPSYWVITKGRKVWIEVHIVPIIWASDIRFVLLFWHNFIAPNSLPFTKIILS